MKTTRQTILDYLERNQICSAQEISYALNMTPANARHHLSTLQNQGIVQVMGHLPTQKRGRPTLLYALAAQANQHNLDQLAHVLLTELLVHFTQEQRTAALKRIARRLNEDSRFEKAPLTQLLLSAVNWLNQNHYQSRWEARADGPRLILGHCPYASIVHDHPELCSMDAYLIEGLLGRPVDQVDKLAMDSRGALFCMFTFTKP